MQEDIHGSKDLETLASSKLGKWMHKWWLLHIAKCSHDVIWVALIQRSKNLTQHLNIWKILNFGSWIFRFGMLNS